MKQTIKLVIYYFIYQMLFTSLITLPSIWNQLMQNGGDLSSYAEAGSSTNMIGLSMVLSGIAMIWHLIHFKYVKFNLKSFTEISWKIIGLSIPFRPFVTTPPRLFSEARPNTAGETDAP